MQIGTSVSDGSREKKIRSAAYTPRPSTQPPSRGEEVNTGAISDTVTKT